jgi:hypothetical protein
LPVALPRCDAARAFVRRMASGETRGALGYVVPVIKNEVAIPPYGWVDYQDHPERLLEKRLAELNQRRWGHDHAVPIIQPMAYGGGLLATAFGARYDPRQNWTHPRVTRAEDIAALPLDVTLHDGLIPKALEAIDYIVRQTDGQVPIQMYNVGGPMDIASMVVDDQELMLALSLFPQAVHRLLDACTELFIAFVRAQREMVPDFVPTLVDDMYWPDGLGVLCGEDWLSVISPKMALEFEIPYINRISEAFGGVMIHACGSLHINFETLKTHVRNLRGLYFNAGECSFPQAVKTFRGTDVVLMPRWAVNTTFPFASRLDFVHQLLAAKAPDVSVFLMAFLGVDPLIQETDPNDVSRQVLRMIERFVAEGALD